MSTILTILGAAFVIFFTEWIFVRHPLEQQIKELSRCINSTQGHSSDLRKDFDTLVTQNFEETLTAERGGWTMRPIVRTKYAPKVKEWAALATQAHEELQDKSKSAVLKEIPLVVMIELQKFLQRHAGETGDTEGMLGTLRRVMESHHMLLAMRKNGRKVTIEDEEIPGNPDPAFPSRFRCSDFPHGGVVKVRNEIDRAGKEVAKEMAKRLRKNAIDLSKMHNQKKK